MDASTATRPRRRLFGPLLYATLALGALATLYSVAVIVRPGVEEWLEIRSLAKQLLSPHAGPREAAATAVVMKGPAVSIPLLWTALRDAQAEVRSTACRRVLEAGADVETTVSMLLSTTGDRDEVVRLMTAQTLGRLPMTFTLLPPSPAAVTSKQGLSSHRERCVTALRELLQDTSGAVRAAAVTSLAGFGPDPAALDDLRITTKDVDPSVRLEAARALLTLNGPDDPTAVQTMLVWLTNPEAETDRRTILFDLLKAGPEAQETTITALAALLSEGDPIFRAETIDLLRDAGPEARAAVPAIEAALGEDDWMIRTSAFAALVEIEGPGSPRGSAILARMIADPDLREEARHEALARLREAAPSALADATPDLIRQLADPNPRVRELAITLLQQIIYDHPARMPSPSAGS
jgi:HEAT repeat protein